MRSITSSSKAVSSSGGTELGDCNASEVQLGSAGPGFCFDNELELAAVRTPAFQIDSRALSWGRYSALHRSRWVCRSTLVGPEPAGVGVPWAAHAFPRYLRGAGGTPWEIQQCGHWQPLDTSATAVHLSAFEAQAGVDGLGVAYPLRLNGYWRPVIS
jgi:hypothetical protein